MSFLVTLIFLLADGTPAGKADVACSGIATFTAGDDDGTPGSNKLIVDSRGAIVLQVADPVAITCSVSKDAQAWAGDIRLSYQGQVVRISLR